MDIGKALLYKFPGAEWTLNGDLYSGLEWLDKIQAKPTEGEVIAAWLEYVEKAQYIEKRRADLNVESPVFDMIIAMWEKVVENRPESADAIQLKRKAVKDRYPKGGN